MLSIKLYTCYTQLNAFFIFSGGKMYYTKIPTMYFIKKLYTSYKQAVFYAYVLNNKYLFLFFCFFACVFLAVWYN